MTGSLMRTWITAQKLKFSIKNFFNKCNQIHSFLRIWCPLLEKSLMENFSFWAVNYAAFRKVNFFFNKIFYRKLNEIISLVQIASFSFPRKIFLKRKWTITTVTWWTWRPNKIWMVLLRNNVFTSLLCRKGSYGTKDWFWTSIDFWYFTIAV